MEEIICPHCGKPNSPSNKFCDYCLGQLKQSDEQISEAEHSEIGIGRDDLGEQAPEEYGPDWLKNLQDDHSVKGEEPIDLGDGLSTPSEMISDWMSGDEEESLTTEAGESPPGEGSQVQPFLPDDGFPEDDGLPDWLDDALLDRSEQDGFEADSRVDPAIEGSEQDALQKDPDATKPSQGKLGELESAGPLAGLKGALSPEPGITRPRKPAAYTTKLRVTATQRAHVDLLASIVEDEGHTKPLPERKAISQRHVLRWVITIILLIAISWPIVTSSQQMPFPAYEEVSAEVSRLVSQLNGNSPVLFVFDYEPGLTAEFDAATTPVMDHVISRGALLTLVSISPSGPILAERFMGLMQASHEYKSGEQYVNLGYIPGGAAGLVSFFDNPQNTLPYTLDGVPAWETSTNMGLPPLTGINEITDYEMVVLLVDDPDTARTWIEQLSPRINEPDVLTSFVLITSAQLEPIVLPYYDSSPPQVNGLVAGLRGGAVYAQINGNGDIARKYWDAFGMGTFTAALLILVGGLGYYVIPELMRSPQVQRKGK
jgi:hypothetical protein